MYKIEQIKEFIAILEQSSLNVFELQDKDGSKIRLEKAPAAQQVIAAAPAPQQTAPAPVNTAAPAPAEQAAADDSSKTIDSPIVGVFYAAPSPGATPYATVGKTVKKGDTVCIVEAMKCMNEIQAEEDGVITEVLAKDGELVEYGQPLFKIK